MQIGRLRHLVTIWAYTETQDEFGEPLKNYEQVGKAWAEIRPLTGRENFDDKELITEQTHKILMRYLPIKPDSTMQIRYNGRVFEVIGAPVDVYERNIQLQFNVKEVFDHANTHP